MQTSTAVKVVERVSVSRLIQGQELPNREIFINARPMPSDRTKVLVRLFDVNDRIVTRTWNANATVELEFYQN